MPPSIRPEQTILEELIAALISNGLVDDVAPISILRQISSGVSTTIAEMYFSLFSLYQSFFFGLANGTDLDTRGRDMGALRDTGQAASGDVAFYRTASYLEDVPLPTPQHIQPTVNAGVVVPTYSTIADATLEARGRSISNDSPFTQITGGVNDNVRLNLDGDGIKTVTLGTQATGAAIAAALQAAVRAVIANTPALQPAYDRFSCDWGVTNAGRFTLRSGNPGPTSSVVVTAAASNNAAPTLKLGMANGGVERVGMDSVAVPCQADSVGDAGNIGAEQITAQLSPASGISNISNLLPFVNGRNPAGDDGYRQAIREHLLALGRGTQDSVSYAAEQLTRINGAQVVQSVQVLQAGTANIAIFVADGRSLTLGAQPQVVQAVQDEIDGRGTTPGGWVPSGVTALAQPATIRVIDVVASLLISPGPDLVIIQRQAIQTIARTLGNAPVGHSVSYVDMLRALDVTIPNMLRMDFATPTAWSITPQADIGAIPGTKLMPGTIQVEVQHG